MNDSRIKVALVFGGRSSEHAISCVSAGSVLRNLDQDAYEVVAVGVTPEGGWVLTDGDPAQLAISDRTLPQVTWIVAPGANSHHPSMSDPQQAATNIHT